MQTIFPCRWPTQPGRPGQRRSEPLLAWWWWTDGCPQKWPKIDQKWALAPQVLEIRPQKIFWGNFSPFGSVKKIGHFFVRPTKKIEKPQVVVFFDPGFFVLEKFRVFGSQVVDFSKIFNFFFWVPNGFGGGLGVF